MIPIVTVEQMRAIEADADANGISYDTMMENAGRAAAQRALQIIADLPEPRITILVGKGNNGGDGLVTGRYIAEREDAEVRFYLMRERDDDDPNLSKVQEMGLFMAYAEDDHDNRVLRNMVASADLVIDALFGIGIRLPVRDDAATLLRNVNQALNERRRAVPDEMIIFPDAPDQSTQIPQQTVLAIDCPSGLNCDTGELDSNVIYADETITFITPKIGQFTYPGAAAVGQLSIATIGVPRDLMQEAERSLVSARDVRALLPERSSDSNKGTYGKTMAVSGSVNYSGAAGLAAGAAYRIGAGLVTVGAPMPVIPTLAAQSLEMTWLFLPHDMGVLSEQAVSVLLKELDSYASLLLGPGWGQEEGTGDFLKNLLDSQVKKPAKRRLGFGVDDDKPNDEPDTVTLPPLIIDADGLNLLAKMENWWEHLPENTIITPHPGEMGRLAQIETSEVQADRVEIARQKAADWNVILLLKGAHTLIAAPDGRVVVLPFKTDALSTAGTGDVLAGVIAGLLAQGLDPFDAAVAGGYLHGLAGMLAVQQQGSTRGVIAGDVLAALPQAFGLVEKS